MPRILVVLANANEVGLFVTLGGMLEERGATVRFLSTEYSISRQAWELGVRAPNVMHTRVGESAPCDSVEGVSLEDVCRYVLANPFLETDSATLFAQAGRLVRAYARHFDRVRPSLVVSWNGSIPRVRSAMKLAEARGIPTLYFEQGNFPSTIICDPKGVNYEGSMRDFEVPRDFDRARISDFMERFRSRSLSRKGRPAVSGSALADALINFFPRRSPFHPTLHFHHDKAVSLTRFLRRLAEYVKLRLGSRKTAADESELPERFVFLPLQVHDDTQIIVHSPLIRTMEQLVGETLRALPEECDMVVKSHPADEGRRGYRIISEMLEGPRHRFLHGGSTLDMVKQSGCVVTVNSTVGLEALALGKPVVVLGNAVYAGRGITVDVKESGEFPEKLRDALEFRPDPDEVKRFLDYYVFEYSWPGNFRDPDSTELAPLADYMFTHAGGKAALR